MDRTFFQGRGFEERRHTLGALILLSLLFVGHYMPVILTLFLMVVVTWMAIISFGKIHRGLVVSAISFLIPFVILALRDWRATGPRAIGPWESAELSLEVSVLISMIICAVMWVKKILRSKQAGFNQVVGACNLYIWIAIIYACLYTVISKINPRAFRLDGCLSSIMNPWEVKQNFDNLYYFSFVTQTTLGYGDIVPVSHFARSLAVSQAIIGQFYVAVVLTYILNLWIRDLGHQMGRDIGKPGESS